MTGWFADVRIALRLLRRRPGWTASVLATLALAIGANSALFSVLDAALLQPLPFPAPERLMLIGETAPSFPQMSVSYPDYVDWRARTRSFDEMGVYRGGEVNLTGIGAPRRASVIQASASYFRTIGVAPLMGRTFEEEEDVRAGRQSSSSARRWRGSSTGSQQWLSGNRSRWTGCRPWWWV
jgi:putative ABC transport system permease protein